MGDAYESNLAGVLLALRQMLLDTRETNDSNGASALLTTFAVLLDASYLTPNRRLSAILEELESSARDFAGGMYGKSTIPAPRDVIEAVHYPAPMS